MVIRFFLFLSVVASYMTLLGQSINVLKNPGFEENNNSWTILNAGDYQTDVVKSGNSALRISQDVPKFSGATQTIAFPEGIRKVRKG